MERMERTNRVTEKARIRQCFAKALSSYNEHAVAQRHIHGYLEKLLRDAGRTVYGRLLEIGCGTGGFTRRLVSTCGGHGAEWVLNDLCTACREPVSECMEGEKWSYLCGDAEQVTFTGKYDLIASASVIQWFARPEACIRKWVSLLNPGGYLLLNTFGKKNLKEIKSLTGNGLEYPAVQEVAGWVDLPEMKILHLQEETLTLLFPSPADVLKHLKYTGVTATGSGSWTKGQLQHFCTAYASRYSVQQEVALTYQPIYLLAVKK